MKKFVNVAYAAGICDEKPIRAVSNPVVITKHQKCRCVSQCVCKTLSICDLYCFKKCRIKKVGVKCFNYCGKTVVKFIYKISITYINCCGNIRKTCCYGSGLFWGLPEDLDESNISVKLTNGSCICNCCNEVIVQFIAKLCY